MTFLIDLFNLFTMITYWRELYETFIIIPLLEREFPDIKTKDYKIKWEHEKVEE